MNLSDYPSGFVTLVFTDIQGSTTLTNILNAREPGHYEEKMRDPHRVRLAELVKQNRGFEIQRAGDGHLWVFHTSHEAIKCMVEFQRNLQANPIVATHDEKPFAVKVRIGIHCETGIVPQLSIDANGREWIEYPGEATNYASRLTGIAGGGQILLSEAVHKDKGARPELTKHSCYSWHDRYFKSFEDVSQTVHELLYYDGQKPREPGLRFFSAWYQDERNSYITREKEEQDVIACFSAQSRGSKPRLITIHAEGGMGKTRIAITCALKIAGIFGNNIHFVKLDDVAPNPYTVAEAIGKVLGKNGPQAQPDALIESLRNTKILLLLDNYESCANDEVARFIGRLVSQTTGVHLFVTGRQPVGVRNIEQIVQLGGGLTYPQARELFLARAALDGSHVESLTAQEDEQLNRILRLVSVAPDDTHSGPIPLAIELAAAWWSEKTLKEIADGLEATPLKKYMEPVPGMIAEGEIRHESLHRSLQWSYDLLGKIPEIGSRLQTTFALCGLFPETFDSDIVHEIGGDPDTDELLIRLHRASMLQGHSTSERTFYRLHHFSCEYAREKLLEIPSGKEFKSVFITYYAKLLKAHKDVSQISNHLILDDSWHDALTAAQWAVEAQDYQMFSELADGLIPFFQLRSLWSECAYIYLQLLEYASKVGHRRAEGAILNNLGAVYQLQNRWQEAEQACTQNLAVCREFKDRTTEGRTLNNLGNIYQSQNRFQEAEQAYSNSLNIKRELKDRTGEGSVLNNIMAVYHAQKRWSEAEQATLESLAICHELKDRIGEGQTLNNLGVVYQAQGRWQEAEQAHISSLTICSEFKDHVGEGQALNNLGTIYQFENRWQEAEQAYKKSLAIFREFKNRAEEARSLNNLGLAYQSQSRFQEAEQAYQDSVDIKRELKDSVGEGKTLGNIAILHESQGNLVDAINVANKALNALSNTQAISLLERTRATLERIKNMIGNTSDG